MSTPPLPPRLRLIVRVTKLLLYGDFFTWTEEGDLATMMWTSPYELRELDVTWTRNAAGAPADDVAMCTFHLLNLTSGSPDSTWTTGDFTAAEALFDTWWTTIKPNWAPATVLSEYVWRKDGPAFRPFGTELSPVVRRVARSVAGTGAGYEMLPPQVALSVTERTAARYTAEDVEGVGDQLRNRWGRFYLPAPHNTAVAAGRPVSALRTSVAAACGTLYNGLRAADLIPVMYSPTTGNAWSVDELAVDDVFDVVRSRRYRHVITRSTATTTG